MFEKVNEIDEVAQNVLQKRYFKDGETMWEDIANRVCDHIIDDTYSYEESLLTHRMLANRYFIPNSPCLVNSGTTNGGLVACFVVDFNDSILDIYKTKLDFALIAKKGGGCGTTLSKLRPEKEQVEGSTHGYAGGPIKFFDTICHDMEAMTQAGFREMAMMGVMSCYHPDIIKFIKAKETEGKLRLSNLSVMVDDAFMRKVENNEEYTTFFTFPDGVKLYEKLNARDVFNLIVESAWKNGEPGLLFYDRINDSPYKYSNQEILATNPCLVGDTLVQTVEGQIKIKDLINQSAYVYCVSEEGILTISKAFSIRKTKENAHLVRVQTSRGHIICTPEHKFYTRNRGYVEARNLTKKDKIVGLNRKMHGEHYCSISITGSKFYEKEHRFIMRHFEDIASKDVHHKDDNYLNNVRDNLEVLTHKYHSSITNKGHRDWNDHDERGYFISKKEHQKKKQMKLDNGNPKGLNLVILGVEDLNYTEDVYDLEVEKFHNFFANGVLVHNCGEQPLPPNGSCNLGSLDLSKFVTEDGMFDTAMFKVAVQLGVKFLDKVLDKNKFPTEDTEKWAMENRPVGLGVMGLADYFLKTGFAYGSEESIRAVRGIFNFMKQTAEETSIELGRQYGIPKACKLLPVPRRNITVLTVAPTGSIAIIAGCNSGIEPVFSEITTRKDKTGTYQITHPDYGKEHFRCAVSSNGAEEVTWEEHIQIQDAVQEFVDSGVSKTCNFPNHTRKETIAKAYFYAWKLGHVKGLTVYRNGSRELEVLSPKNLKKDKCPVCGSDLIRESGCKKCSSCDFSVCEIA